MQAQCGSLECLDRSWGGLVESLPVVLGAPYAERCIPDLISAATVLPSIALYPPLATGQEGCACQAEIKNVDAKPQAAGLTTQTVVHTLSAHPELGAEECSAAGACRAEGLGGVMEENRARLAERSEKLRGLQDKTDRMQVLRLADCNWLVGALPCKGPWDICC